MTFGENRKSGRRDAYAILAVMRVSHNRIHDGWRIPDRRPISSHIAPNLGFDVRYRLPDFAKTSLG